MLPEITIDRDTPLTLEILQNPLHPVVTLLLRLYSLESFLYGTLNKALRFGDKSKVETLGAYAHALNTIVSDSGGRRKDIKLKDMEKINLYRGCSMTEAQIQRYRDQPPNK